MHERLPLLAGRMDTMTEAERRTLIEFCRFRRHEERQRDEAIVRALLGSKL